MKTRQLSIEQRRSIARTVTKWKSVSVGATLTDVVRITVAEAWVSKSAGGTPRDTVMRARRPSSIPERVAAAPSNNRPTARA